MNISTFGKSAAAAVVLLALLASPAAALQLSDPNPEDPSGGIPPSLPKYEFPTEGFRWTAPDRMNRWASAWRERDIYKAWPTETYQPAYVNPTSWQITMMGCQTELDFIHSYVSAKRWKELQFDDPDVYVDPVNRYKWEVDGKSGSFSTKCYGDLHFPAQGIYYVKLTVRRPNQPDQSWTLPVEVKDFLIVVLGDSSASGEGAPDVPVTAGIDRAKWVDKRCHRSGYAGGAQAARHVELSDPRSSVTFLSFACSGATLHSEIYDSFILDPYENETDYGFRGVGITAPYAGIEPVKVNGNHDFSQKLPSQIQQLWNALTGFGKHPPRKIDALIVAGGINDARFADLAAVCVLYDFCPAEVVGETNFPPRPGDAQRTLDAQFHHDVAKVAPGWDKLGQQLNELRTVGGKYYRIEADRMLALQYPSFFHNDFGHMCSLILNDTLPWWVNVGYPTAGWDLPEIAWANDYWAPALDEAVRLGAERNDFTFVDTISDRFFHHGICAFDRYINTPTDAAAIQGDGDGESGPLASLGTKGLAHPNVKGYAAYADEILRHLGHLMKKEGNQPPVAVMDLVPAGKGMVSYFNVLDNDSDPDPMDVLAARIETMPANGTLTLKTNGAAEYKPKAGFEGLDEFYYEVTDGTDARIGRVVIEVVDVLKVRLEAYTGGVAVFPVDVLLGGAPLAPPYELILDKPLKPTHGEIRFDVNTGAIYFEPPTGRRGGVRVGYTLYSRAPTSVAPTVPAAVRGILKVKVKKPR